MVRRPVPSDNSCLFNSISLLVEGEKKPDLLRQKVAERIRADETYSEAILGKSKSDYCTWILNPDKWGGEIELTILAGHYKVQIIVIYVEGLTHRSYGAGETCIYLMYDGIHYDPIARNMFEDAP